MKRLPVTTHTHRRAEVGKGVHGVLLGRPRRGATVRPPVRVRDEADHVGETRGPYSQRERQGVGAGAEVRQARRCGFLARGLENLVEAHQAPDEILVAVMASSEGYSPSTY